jgi:hypothetical protein
MTTAFAVLLQRADRAPFDTCPTCQAHNEIRLQYFDGRLKAGAKGGR